MEKSDDINKMLLSYLLSKEKERSQNNPDIKEQNTTIISPEELKLLLSQLQEKSTFEVGEVVTWKNPLFKNRHYPLENQPAIVVEVLDNPVVDNEVDTTSVVFGVKYDIVLGVIINNVFYTFYFESQRFKKFED
ncbi:hypothetical protein [Acinetobacter bereziniae]|uniref:hypothetical protein n=1 Tax=Acinetobacter bereziniae TaxID=106648 RepID=UPI00124F7CD2|nr:hypothetical protein [Acinetobacter bereziniae]